MTTSGRIEHRYYRHDRQGHDTFDVTDDDLRAAASSCDANDVIFIIPSIPSSMRGNMSSDRVLAFGAMPVRGNTTTNHNHVVQRRDDDLCPPRWHGRIERRYRRDRRDHDGQDDCV
jgi:hypothetical protein